MHTDAQTGVVSTRVSGDLPVFDDERQPVHQRGIVTAVPGLYFVGLFFLHAMWSETITGVQHVVKHLVGQRATQPARHPTNPRIPAPVCPWTVASVGQ